MKRCPVCGHRDNCSTWEYNHNAIFCRRVVSDRPGAGGWTHILDGEAPEERPALRVVKPQPVEAKADRYILHTVYETILRRLFLLPEHKDNLLSRGLDMEAIERGMFRSTPTEEEAEEIVREIVGSCEPVGVPGFYFDGRWRLVKMPSGFLIPIRDRAGLIQGLQVRRDYLMHAKDNRYAWVSSKNDIKNRYPRGTSPCAPVHFQNPERIIETGRAVVTEGVLKGFVSSYYLSPSEGGIICLASVSCFQDNFALHLKEAFPSLHSISIAFDRDWQQKREVKGQLHRLMRVLKSQEFNVSIYEWDTQEKGLDDYLVAEARERAAA
jgi:hypothetical protein